MTINLLLVEDNPGDREIVSMFLRASTHRTYNVKSVSRISEALKSLKTGSYDLVLLDLSLPDSDGGLTTIRNLLVEFDSVPLVVLTGNADLKFGLDAVKTGAQDFLVKGEFDKNLLVKTIDYAIERYRLVNDLKHLAMIDTLTGLYNRNGFFSLGEHKYQFAKRREMKIIIIFCDLDNMKIINDTYGHDEGDAALINTADIIKKTMRSSDLIARIGGDEFVAMGFIKNKGCSIKDRIEEHINNFNMNNNKGWSISLSMGFVYYQEKEINSGTGLNELIQLADSAMYKQKQQKKLKQQPV